MADYLFANKEIKTSEEEASRALQLFLEYILGGNKTDDQKSDVKLQVLEKSDA